MMDAALAYAAFGLPVFPLDRNSKAPIPRRDPDPSGQFEDGIPGTGGVYKATTDPLQIMAWWRAHPKALIGLPMGAASGVWALDIDTSEDHADGVAEWEKIAAQHDPIVTREHRSATGGPHLLFVWSEAMPIRCGKGDLPSGIEVKGSGGYIAMPPSIRKGRSYTVHSDIDQIGAPTWLTDLILQGRPAIKTDNISLDPAWWGTEVDLDELREALLAIPNPHFDWVEWKNMALRLYAGLGDHGWAFLHEWSQKFPEYDPRTGPSKDRECWQQVKSSPPDRTGVNKIFSIAREHGWTAKLRELPADGDSVTIKSDDEVTAEAART